MSLADIMSRMGKAGSPKGASPSPDLESDADAPDSESGENSAKEYARVCVEALADKDFEAATDALLSCVQASK